MHTRKAIHKLDNIESFSFDISKYSEFKYGNLIATKDIAYELAKSFISIGATINKEIVVTGGAYRSIPTASTILKDEFIKCINEMYYHMGMSPISGVRMYRQGLYSSDYSKLDVGGRADLLFDDIFYIDKQQIKDKHLVCIDDICVTGIHETKVTNAISNACDTTYLYYIDTSGEIARLNPEVENIINSSIIKDVYDLLEMMYSTYSSNEYRLTSRAVKMILDTEEPEFTMVAERLVDIGIAEEVFYAAIGNNYQSIESYKVNINYLREKL